MGPASPASEIKTLNYAAVGLGLGTNGLKQMAASPVSAIYVHWQVPGTRARAPKITSRILCRGSETANFLMYIEFKNTENTSQVQTASPNDSVLFWL